jgi:hypothetical protein
VRGFFLQRAEQTMSTRLLDDYADVEVFAAEVDRTPRTVRRWMNTPGGLPYTRLGSRRLVHVPSAKEWLLSKMTGVGRAQ